jgi:hypothetical protein
MARAVAAHEAGEVPASWAHNADMAAMYAGGQGGSGSGSSWSPASSSSASSSSARPTTASQGHVFDPTGEGYVARSSDDEKPPRKKRKLGGSEECSAKK